MNSNQPQIGNEKNSTYLYYSNGYKYTSLAHLQNFGNMHGVKRVIVFCFTIVILPTILITTPLYLRHSVFGDVIYPVAESDVLLVEDGMSSIFCQTHTLRMNSSFNAFKMTGTPRLSSQLKHIRLKKSMTLPDDTLEYWGFYLLKGALVKLKVCSRYDGSRILVVKGDKNLKTCGLLDHNTNKYGAKMDPDFGKVKVTFENAAEVIGLVEDNLINPEVENLDNSDINASTHHHKRHMKHKQEQLKKLKQELEVDDQAKREKRSYSPPLDAHITHGGNAKNHTNLDESDVSSFETDLLTCYNGQILLSKEFPPSKSCMDVHYLEKSNHMVTNHEVVKDGYYYYIFYSDNDVFQNDIHAVFDIYKPTYRYANSSRRQTECINQTECSFPITFFSDETVIVEVPTRDGIEHEEDDITYLISTCQPRMAVYIIFPISVLLLILSCAFL